MLTLYSYPELFGVADNNGYGLKVYAFLKLAGVPFIHEHIFDASSAPRGQLPYIVDDGETIGDSEAIIVHLIGKYRLGIDAALTPAQRDTDLLVTRMLDDLYWVMSYSRWKDDRYFPAFRDAFMREHPHLTAEGLDKARAFNFQRYHFQGIGAIRPRAPTRAVSPTSACWPASSPPAATCTATSRLASTRRSSGACHRIPTWCATAKRSTPP
jgi:hypothetical protein